MKRNETAEKNWLKGNVKMTEFTMLAYDIQEFFISLAFCHNRICSYRTTTTEKQKQKKTLPNDVFKHSSFVFASHGMK